MEILMGWGTYLKDHRGWGRGMDIFWNYTILDTIFVAPFQDTVQGLMCTYVEVFSCHLNLVLSVQILHNFISAG